MGQLFPIGYMFLVIWVLEAWWLICIWRVSRQRLAYMKMLGNLSKYNVARGDYSQDEFAPLRNANMGKCIWYAMTFRNFQRLYERQPE
jgi:hypothetical protein